MLLWQDLRTSFTLETKIFFHFSSKLTSLEKLTRKPKNFKMNLDSVEEGYPMILHRQNRTKRLMTLACGTPRRLFVTFVAGLLFIYVILAQTSDVRTDDNDGVPVPPVMEQPKEEAPRAIVTTPIKQRAPTTEKGKQ